MTALRPDYLAGTRAAGSPKAGSFAAGNRMAGSLAEDNRVAGNFGSAADILEVELATTAASEGTAQHSEAVRPVVAVPCYLAGRR